MSYCEPRIEQQISIKRNPPLPVWLQYLHRTKGLSFCSRWRVDSNRTSERNVMFSIFVDIPGSQRGNYVMLKHKNGKRRRENWLTLAKRIPHFLVHTIELNGLLWMNSSSDYSHSRNSGLKSLQLRFAFLGLFLFWNFVVLFHCWLCLWKLQDIFNIFVICVVNWWPSRGPQSSRLLRTIFHVTILRKADQ